MDCNCHGTSYHCCCTWFRADGWRYSWYILGTIVLVVAVIVFSFLRNQPEDKGLLPVGQEEKDENQNSSSKNTVSSLDWTTVYRMKALWYLGLVYFFTDCPILFISFMQYSNLKPVFICLPFFLV